MRNITKHLSFDKSPTIHRPQIFDPSIDINALIISTIGHPHCRAMNTLEKRITYPNKGLIDNAFIL